MMADWRKANAVELHDLGILIICSKRLPNGEFQPRVDGVFRFEPVDKFIIPGSTVKKLLGFLGREVYPIYETFLDKTGHTKDYEVSLENDEFSIQSPLTVLGEEYKSHIVDLEAKIELGSVLSIKYSEINSAGERWDEEMTYCGKYSISWVTNHD